MTGVVLQAGFNDTAITRHLALLAIMDVRGFDSVRREIGDYFKSEVQDNLEGQKLFDGSPMLQSQAALTGKGRAGYKAATKPRKTANGRMTKGRAASGKPGKTLIDHHHLYDSYDYQLAGGGVEIGSDLVYAAIHHFGGETGRAGHRFTLPARPVLGIAARQEAAIGNFLIAEIRKAQP